MGGGSFCSEVFLEREPGVLVEILVDSFIGSEARFAGFEEGLDVHLRGR